MAEAQRRRNRASTPTPALSKAENQEMMRTLKDLRVKKRRESAGDRKDVRESAGDRKDEELVRKESDE